MNKLWKHRLDMSVFDKPTSDMSRYDLPVTIDSDEDDSSNDSPDLADFSSEDLGDG